MSSRLRQALNLPFLKKECLLIKTFGSNSEQIENCNLVQLCLQGIRDDSSVYVTDYEVPKICSPPQNQKINSVQQKFSHFEGIEFADFCEGPESETDVLNGMDNYCKLVTGNVIKSGVGPVATETVFGWVISGPVDEVSAKSEYSINLVDTHLILEVQTAAQLADESLDNQLRKLWKIESLGILPDVNLVHEKFQENINLHEGRYCVGLIWKDNHPFLPDNYQLSVNRLKSLFS